MLSHLDQFPYFINILTDLIEAHQEITQFKEQMISQYHLWSQKQNDSSSFYVFENQGESFSGFILVAPAATLQDWSMSDLSKTVILSENKDLFCMYAIYPCAQLPFQAKQALAIACSQIKKINTLISFHLLTKREWIFLFHKKNDHHPFSLSRIVDVLNNLGFLLQETTHLSPDLVMGDLLISQKSCKEYSSRESIINTLDHVSNQAFRDSITLDPLAQLILLEGLSWRQIDILRTCIAYLIQIQFPQSRELMQETILEYSSLSRLAINIFEARFDPSKNGQERDALTQNYLAAFDQDLKQVDSLLADRFLRKIVELIRAIVRTNYYQITPEGDHKAYLSIKLNPKNIKEMALPVMMAEIFVYHHTVEGIHLRTSKVARGGIRWSDRGEDYRTEILGLVKAQQIKNTLIVPSGAKGGFFIKDSHWSQKSKEEQAESAKRAYTLFISGLLDLTDCQPHLLSPDYTICYDERDPYLVVAADKGTASFSDLANNLSARYHHWLKDAFASGGSQGYDHKKIGITAKGAFLSAAHHARNLGMSQKGTMIGIGDMSGDVFGNGAILWPNLDLIAAFNHQHIFIDPHPKPEAYQERLRMQALPKSTWNDFNRQALSEGAMIIPRSQKEIILTPQIKNLLNIQDVSVDPDTLIRSLLCLPVDVLFNGGIGTYIKSSEERHSDVSDKANDAIRVNGNQVQAKMIIEGGNMGVTQKGRIEYSRLGGKINTDTVDNSGGVDCSDHEVNFKILIDSLIQQKIFDESLRSAFLAQATESVAENVLKHNQQQNQTISFMEYVSIRDRFLHQEVLEDLVQRSVLDLNVAGFDSLSVLHQQACKGVGFSRPELIVLFAYVKMDLKNKLLSDQNADSLCQQEFLEMAFPKQAVSDYANYIKNHPLARQIAMTHLVNYCLQFTGISFYYRLSQETQVPLVALFESTLLAMKIFDIPAQIETIESIYSLPFSKRYEAILQLYRLLFRTTKWIVLHQGELPDWKSLKDRITRYETEMADKDPLTRALHATTQFPALGLSVYCAQDHSCDLALFPLFKKVYQLIGASDIESKIEQLPARTAFEAQARSLLREDFLNQIQNMTYLLLKGNQFECLETSAFLAQWRKNLESLLRDSDVDFCKIFVSIRFLERAEHFIK